LAIGEAAGGRGRAGPGGAGAHGRGGLAGHAAAGPGRPRRSWADPVASVLAVVALMATRWSHTSWSCCCSSRSAPCPGPWAGSPAGSYHGVSLAVVQRLLELLLGGALLAQVAPATAPGTPPGHRWDRSDLPSTASLALGGSVGPSTPSGPATASHAGTASLALQAMGPAGARPTPRRSAAPLPPWLGAGRPTRRPVSATRLARPWRPRTAATQAPRQRPGIARRRATPRLQHSYRFGVVPEG
jgi:hypothetical protein